MASVVLDKAHSLDYHVIYFPLSPLELEPVVDRNVATALIENVRFDKREVPLHSLVIVEDLFIGAGIMLDPADVSIIEKLFEKLGELLALFRRLGFPGASQRSFGHFFEVEILIHNT